MEMVVEIWTSARPYLVIIGKDAVISLVLWFVLYLFKWVTKLFPIDGWAGEWILDIHSVGAVLAFSAFGILFAADVIKLHTGGERRHD